MSALRKMAEAGIEVKFNDRIHARLLVAFNRLTEGPAGFLVLGSFDYNQEGMGAERCDAGIKTRYPDLVQAAAKLFEKIWTESDSKGLDELYKKPSTK